MAGNTITLSKRHMVVIMLVFAVLVWKIIMSNDNSDSTKSILALQATKDALQKTVTLGQNALQQMEHRLQMSQQELERVKGQLAATSLANPAVLSTQVTAIIPSVAANSEFVVPIQSASDCKSSWYRGTRTEAEMKQIDTHSVREPCYSVASKKVMTRKDNSEECRRWFMTDTHKECFGKENPHTTKGSKESVQEWPWFNKDTKDLVQAYMDKSGNTFGCLLSCNDPYADAILEGEPFNLQAAAKNPVRTFERAVMFDTCFVQPWCDKVRGIKLNDEEIERGASYKQGISQDGQDRWVADFFKYKTDGAYLEIGASDGLQFSNGFLLDKCYGWSGLMVEANWMRYLNLAGANRGGDVMYGCVGGKDEFLDFTLAAGLSSVNKLDASDVHQDRRAGEKKGTMLEASVPCFDFNELALRWMRHRKITVIDYMSIDIEGAEWAALSSLDLARVPIRLIGVELDGYADEARIESHLQKHGYKKVGTLHDTFFYKEYA